MPGCDECQHHGVMDGTDVGPYGKETHTTNIWAAPSNVQCKVNGKLVEKGVRAYLRKVSDPASINRKELRSALENKLGVDLSEWKATIKDAAVAFMTAMGKA